MIEATSVEAYIETAPQRELQREAAYRTVCLALHPSSSDIARFTGLPRTSVCGRLRELEKEGRIHKAADKIDPFTRKRVHWYAPGRGEA